MQIQSNFLSISNTLAIAFLLTADCFSQTVGQFKFQEQVYNIYPYRISDDDIPIIGINIPDGKYVVFENFSFRRKRSLKRKKKYVLRDTTIVKAIITIQKNIPEGHAIFYYYDNNVAHSRTKKLSSTHEGNFVKGIKNGTWETRYADGSFRETKNYKDGEENGYCYGYDANGLITHKKKYCGGAKCDTIFYYDKGKLYEEYDICPSYLTDKRSNIYNDAFKLSPYHYSMDVKSYYKRYDLETGKPYIDLKYKNGVVTFFDSLGSKDYNAKLKKTFYHYSVIKTIDENRKVIIAVKTSPDRDESSQSYYYKDFEYLFKEDVTYSIYRSHFIFWIKFVRKNTDHTENYFLDPDSIDMGSLKPVLVQRMLRFKSATSIYYIPKYDFAYNSEKNRQLLKIDTLHKAIYLKQTDIDWHGFKRDYVARYVNDKERKKQEEDHNPFLVKDYILVNKIDLQNVSGFMNQYYPPNSTKFGERSTVTDFYPSYSRYDTLLQGNYCFSNSLPAKHSNKEQHYYRFVNFELDMRSGNFKDGKKEGLWLELGYRSMPKRTPGNFKDWFFAKEKKSDYYNEINYVNGLRDGLCTKYLNDIFCEEGKDRRKEKEKHVVFKQYEMMFTCDTLNGMYKEFHDNGVLKTEANYAMGRPDGDYKTYFFDKTPSALIQFKKGKLHGKYIRRDAEGIKCYANFKENVLTDSLIYYQSQGKPLTCIYTDNERVKQKKVYYHNKNLKEEINFADTSGYFFGKETISSETFLNLLKHVENPTMRKVTADYKNYYENGQPLSEGKICNGEMTGKWKFYSVNGALLHEVTFKDSVIHLPYHTGETGISGIYKGYYSNGKIRGNGYLHDMEMSYDCFTKQDKADFDFYVVDYYNNAGLQTVKQGNGNFVKYDPDGLILAAGKLVNCMPDSLWRFYTPEQKLTEVGFYVNEKREGVWYSGDLEGVNFEDGACFDLNDPAEVKVYEKKRRDLDIVRSIYKDGNRISTKSFRSNLNKTYQPRRHHSVDF